MPLDFVGNSVLRWDGNLSSQVPHSTVLLLRAATDRCPSFSFGTAVLYCALRLTSAQWICVRAVLKEGFATVVCWLTMCGCSCGARVLLVWCCCWCQLEFNTTEYGWEVGFCPEGNARNDMI
jgi:hypothetical protein